ncbi:MAG: hypothetical protein ACKO9V_01615 [Candidatus Kapaibacterium sp.]
MESTLSIVFNEDSVLCAMFEPQAKGWQLSDLAVFNGWYDVFIDDFAATSVGAQLTAYVTSVASRIKDVRIVLPSNAVLNRYLPYLPSASQEQIGELLELEIMQSAPETSVPSYRAAFYPLRSLRETGSVMLAVLNRKSAENNIRNVFLRLGIMDCMFVVRHVCAHSAFLYSYPEDGAETAVLVNVDRTACDVSVLHKRVTTYYNTIPFTEGEDVAKLIARECEENILTMMDSQPTLVLHGDAVTPALIKETGVLLDRMVRSVRRLNAFRMCTTSLDEQHRGFAARSAHRFAVNVGGILQRQLAVAGTQAP